MFLGKGILKICSKFTAEHPCQNVISVKLLCNFIEIALRQGCSPVNLLHIFRAPFLENTYGRLLLDLIKAAFPFIQIQDLYSTFALSKTRNKSAVHRCSIGKLLWTILHNSQESIYIGVLFRKVAGLCLKLYLINRFHRRFSAANFVKLFRKFFYRLLLEIYF